jgi:SAM-dependent methyltransferase
VTARETPTRVFTSAAANERRALVDSRASAAPQLDVDRYNRQFYERCWQAASLLAMPGVRAPAKTHGLQVEIGCGLRPRLPLSEALFVDVSPTACAKLRHAGARVIRASIDALPFASGSVSSLYLFDILEHVRDDARAGRELARVSAAGGWLVLSTPLHAHRWDAFDRVAGHARRYEPRALVDLLCGCGFLFEGFAHFGMRPRSAWLARLGAYYLTHWPRTAFWLEERLLRLTQRWAQPTLWQRAGVDEFVTQIVKAGGAVTAWRRVGAPTRLYNGEQ